MYWYWGLYYIVSCFGWCIENCWVWFLSLSQLLGDMLLDRSNSTVMTRYVSSRENLRILMNLLRVRSFYIKLNYMPIIDLLALIVCFPLLPLLIVMFIYFLYLLLFLVSPKYIAHHHSCYSCSLTKTLSNNIRIPNTF
jgi:hypothetical protein